MTEQKLNLAQKLIEIRKSVDYVKKDTKGHNYSYASGTVVIGALKKKMNELGVLLEPNVVDKEVIYRTVKTRNGERKVITVQANMIMNWVDAETGDERAVSFACFGTQDDISKAFGSALTYSERFFLLKYFNIPTDDVDPDAFQNKTANAVIKPKQPKTTSADIIATDKADTLEQFEAWVVDVTPQVRADLTGVDLDKFKKYLGERRDAFSPKKPQFLICPNNNKEMPVADCAVSDCRETCKNYHDAVR